MMPRLLLSWGLALLAILSFSWPIRAEPARPRKIVLLAGPLDKSHPPGTHEYEKSARLLKYCLDNSTKGIRTEVHLHGWPDDPRTLEDADAIVVIASGSDRRVEDHPLLVGDRLHVLERQMKRGCGLALIHWSTFVPKEKAGDKVLEWVGGYFDYETGPAPRGWYSKIQTATSRTVPATPSHPICRGLTPFELREEYYYNIRFRERDPRLIPILVTPIPGEKGEQVVAWAVERRDSGRGFGFTGGHFFDNWRVENYRRMVLNAVLWLAHVEVPDGGVRSQMPSEREPAARPLSEGKFGLALDGRRHHAEAKGRPEYQSPPLTVECWAKLDDKAGFNLLVANNYKESSAHWEIYSIAGSGNFSAFLPASKPDVLDTKVNIVDGKWHHLVMAYEAERVRMYIDGKDVLDTRITSRGGERRDGPLWFAAYPPQSLGCAGLVDEVRISRGVRTSDRVPEKPLAPDEQTVGLWHFDRVEQGQCEDAGMLHNPARLHAGSAQRSQQGPTSDTELDYRPADPRLKAVLLDRSPEESFVSIKADSEGRLFVGGREALFVYEPEVRGGYGKRHELYRFPPDSWIAGIEVRGNDLYVLTSSALYLFPDGRSKREGLKPRRLVWGVPLDLHVSFHCLAWGPEGDLYLNHGDPLLNYGDFNRPDHWGHWTLFTQPEGTRVPYTGQGAVLRVHPDGSGLRVVAGGLRGPFGLTFDRYWNLFTNDNDHESRPDQFTPARLLHVSPHVDFAWPRGWIASKSPDRADLLETMLNAPGRGVPIGLAYYDELLLPGEYRQNLLEDRWDRLTIQRHSLKRRGASFTAGDHPFLVGRGVARPIGVAVGRGGRVFATISYMAANEASPHYLSDLVLIARADDPPELPFEPYNVSTAPPAKLWAELSNPSWQRRLQAHGEILRRGGDLLVEAAARLVVVKDDDPAILHLPWLAGASRRPSAQHMLLRLARHPRNEVRLQALRVLLDFPPPDEPGSILLMALTDADPQVQLAGLAAAVSWKGELPLPAIVQLACSSDTYLRQSATKLLARRATLAHLAELTRSAEPATRLVAVLAAGFRLTVPRLDRSPPKEVPLSYPSENAFFKVTVRYADAAVDLRSLGRIGSYTMAERWKAVAPDREQAALFDLLRGRLDDRNEPVRLQAAYFLALLRDPRTEPEVSAVFRTVQENRLLAAPLREVGKVWAVGPFDDGGTSIHRAHPPEQGVVDLAATYGKLTWQEVGCKNGRFDLAPHVQPGASSYVFFRLQSATRQTVLLLTAPAGVKVWHNGRPVAGEESATLLLDVQPGSNDLLVRVESDKALSLRYRCRGEATATLPEKLTFAALAERLRAASGTGKLEAIAAEFLEVDWQQQARQGDAAQGRKLFGALGCVKCHAITADQKGGGAPSLTEAGRRFTVPYLVESILLPSRQIAEEFRGTTIATGGGQVFSGLVVNETSDQLELLLPDTTRKTIAKKDIEERSRSNVSPMPAGLVKTPAELRDLLSYLLGDNPLPP